jgi:uncharacterized repeat protein (TIGR02059 family)
VDLGDIMIFFRRLIIHILILVMMLNWNTLGSSASTVQPLAPVSGIATGRVITITFNSTLSPLVSTQANSGTSMDPQVINANATSQFIVNRNGSILIPATASTSGKNLVIILNVEIEPSDIISVRYRPGAAPMKDLSGNMVSPFSEYYVPTTFPEFQPLLTEIKSAGKRVFLFYNKELKATSVPRAENFYISNGSNNIYVVSVSISSHIVELELNDYIQVNQNLNLRYTPTSTPIISVTGFSASPITDYAIPHSGANTMETGSQTPGVLQSASIKGKILILNFNSELKTDVVPKVGQFYVKINNTVVSVSEVKLAGTQAVIYLAKPVERGELVTLSYYAIGTPMQSLNGVSIPAFTDLKIIQDETAITGSLPMYLQLDPGAGLVVNSQGMESQRLCLRLIRLN